MTETKAIGAIQAQVIVIGGGMAGLAACENLAKSGVKVVLVEANNYLGGRVKQIETNDWPPVDMGGEIIHGCNTIVYKLAKKHNWDVEMLFDYEAVNNGLEWIYLDGKLYPYHSHQPDIQAAYNAWGDFVYSNKPDMNTGHDVTAAEYFARHPEINIKSQHIFDVVFCQTEAASLESFGAQEHSDFQNGWECGDGNFRLKNSHKQVVEHYMKNCEEAEIKLNWQAKKIDYSSETITVTNQNGETLKSQTVIVCVPLTVLKDRDITFKPQLPHGKTLAIDKVQMFTGLKIVCRFRERFWPEKTKLVFNCTSDISQMWMYTVEKTGNQCYVVTGFQTADYAKLKAHMTSDEVKEILLNDLNKMFGAKNQPTPASDLLIDYVYYHWSSNPYIRGAYSSPSVNARGSREILARPVANRVFFAGEATRSRGDCATVSGALESGIKAAEEVKKTLKLKTTT